MAREASRLTVGSGARPRWKMVFSRMMKSPRHAGLGLCLAMMSCCLQAICLGAVAAAYAKEIPSYAKEYSGYRVGGKPLTISEKYILQQVVKGQPADLEEEFPGITAAHKLQAGFLEALLTGEFQGLKIHYHGVCIAHATISEKIDLKSAEVFHEVMLKNCTFEDDVLMKDAYFKKNLQIINSKFKKSAYFHRMRVEGIAYFYGSTFEGEASFYSAVIVKELSFTNYFPKITTTFQGDSEFDFIRVGTNALFEGATFKGAVRFSSAQIDGNFVIQGVTFSKNASFPHCKIGHTANFGNATFQGKADLTGWEVKDDLMFDNAKFLSKEQTLFTGIKVGHVAKFQDTLFEGQVKFSNASVGLELEASRAKFNNSDVQLNFDGLKVGSNANFKEAVFAGQAIFDGTNIGSTFNATKAKFSNNKIARFIGLTVGQLAQFTDAVFSGPVDFAGAKIGGDFKADVEQGAKLEAVRLIGQVKCDDANFFNLKINGADNYPLEISQLQLSRTVVERDLSLVNLNIGDFEAQNLQVKGLTNFNNVRITGTADLRGSNFFSLEIDNAKWPASDKLNLSRIGYQFAMIKEGKVNRFKKFLNSRVLANSSLLEWLENSRFYKRNYLDLQEFLKRTGQNKESDKAFIVMKRQEWGLHGWGWLNPLSWPTLFFWDLGVGYGRKPLRILWIALIFVILGAHKFDPKYLQDVEWPTNDILKRLALSVDIFTPSLLNMGMEEKWHPSKSARMPWFIFWYKIFGRIFLGVFFFGIWEYFK